MSAKTIKIVMVGDGAVGKTSIVFAFKSPEGNPLKDFYEPTIVDVYGADIVLPKETVKAKIWDTAGQEAYSSLRQMSYDDTDAFVLCFDISNPTSYNNVENAWVPELRKMGNIPIVLVGTKSDLRSDEAVIARLKSTNKSPITCEQGQSLAKKIKAQVYVECSAFANQGIKDVFLKAAKVVLDSEKKRNKFLCF